MYINGANMDYNIANVFLVIHLKTSAHLSAFQYYLNWIISITHNMLSCKFMSRPLRADMN